VSGGGGGAEVAGVGAGGGLRGRGKLKEIGLGVRMVGMLRDVFLMLGAGLSVLNGFVGAQEPDKKSEWGEFVEKDFPFFSTVLNCRELGEGFAKDNLTPRGLVLNLGNNVWACYDLDLLRIACVWEGKEGKPPVTPEALAPGSYHVAGQKTKDGQEFLPKPVGKVWLTNGIYPGWQVGEKPSFEDPREPGPSIKEVGRGAMDSGHGRLGAVTMARAEVVLEYSVGDCKVQERVQGGEHQGVRFVERVCTIPGHEETLMMVVAERSEVRLMPPGAFWIPEGGDGKMEPMLVEEVAGHWVVRVKGATTGGRLHVRQFLAGVDSSFTVNGPIDSMKREGGKEAFAKVGFGGIETTQGVVSGSKEAYVVDKIALPVPNRWKRNVRLADVDFLDAEGNAVGVTFDGDVWMISGLQEDLEKVTWRRFASGLHEPMSVVVKDGAPFVYDRSGIWKLVDLNGDGECDRYEMFCNLFAQTAETREFPNSMKLGRDGALFISKGGQEGTTRGKHNGTVIKVAADGKSFEVVGHGLRQPFIGVNPVTGLVTASDQQGNWVPSTPIQVIRDNQFYGHLPTVAKGEVYPQTVAEPLVWLPHPVNPSGATQVWAMDERFGPVAGEMIHVGYNRPELFRVVMKGGQASGLHHGGRDGQASGLPHSAAVMSFTRDLEFGPLNAKMNPADGQLYVIGFQVWGTTAKALSGLARIRYTGAPRVLMKELTATDKGVILKFNAKLDKAVAEDPANYSAERWNYRRTEKYGSPHLKLDGSSGQEWMTASSAYLSEDGKSVMVGFPEMKAGVQQMRIGWGIKSEEGLSAQNTAYFTPSDLETFDARAMGFGGVEVNLTPRAAVAVAMGKASAEEGEKLYQMFGCMACHSTDGNLQGKVGPSWKGLFGSEREIANTKGKKVKADVDYLKESILNPGAKVVRGFEKFDAGMPIYEGILNAVQVESLILYIKTLE
jgi:cytochrome c551/c552